MSFDSVIEVEGLGKCYHVYDTPRDRLKQFVLPRVSRLLKVPVREHYREFWALRDINFSVRRGESVGIIGRNGSGKSTLLQLITGTLSPTEGSVRTSGQVSALLELGSGFNPEFSGRENVYLSGALQGYSSKDIDERFDEIAGFADIGAFMELPVKTYSSGMYARLAFSSAIHSDPEILIVDEILAVGDTAFQQRCMKKLYRIMDDGVSILLVSHDAYQVRSICQKALFLQSGAQRFYGSSQRAMDQYVASFGEVEEERLPRTVPTTVAPAEEGAGAFSVSISDVRMRCDDREDTDVLKSGEGADIEFEYSIRGCYEDSLCFVVNLYRDDGVYVFGATSRMIGMDPYPAHRTGKARVHFPSLPLVAGSYKWRVAVNDGAGLHILAEATPVCGFTVEDEFRAVGLVDIPHAWTHQSVEA